METIIVQKLHKYSCNSCHIKTNNKKDFERHLVTAKHLRWSQGVIKKPINKKFTCDNCNKKYHSRNGIWKHKKICLEKTILVDDNHNEISILTKLVTEMLKSNSEFEKHMFEMFNVKN
jgi:ribosomal protein L37AE/L43A